MSHISNQADFVFPCCPLYEKKHRYVRTEGEFSRLKGNSADPYIQLQKHNPPKLIKKIVLSAISYLTANYIINLPCLTDDSPVEEHLHLLTGHDHRRFAHVQGASSVLTPINEQSMADVWESSRSRGPQAFSLEYGHRYRQSRRLQVGSWRGMYQAHCGGSDL